MARVEAYTKETYDLDRKDLMGDDAFVEAFQDAFGYDPREGPDFGPDFDFLGNGFHEARDIVFESQRGYAIFLADWMGLAHDEIDYWLGYDDVA